MSEVWCWWCSHPFEGPTLHLPYRYDDRTKKYTTMGNFCSWGCMKAYNKDRNWSRWGEIAQNITLMRRDTYKKLEPVPCAPKRECLKVFGGTMTIEEFRGCKDPPFVQMPNQAFMVCKIGIGKVEDSGDQVPVERSTAESKMKSIQDSTVKPEELKLKRTKPLKRTESALEKTLGIKRKTQT